jgi:hypothetical protein
MEWYAMIQFLLFSNYGLIMNRRDIKVEKLSGTEFKTAFIIVLGKKDVFINDNLSFVSVELFFNFYVSLNFVFITDKNR